MPIPIDPTSTGSLSQAQLATFDAAVENGGSVAYLARQTAVARYTDAFPTTLASPPTTAFVSPGGSSPVTSPNTIPWGSQLLSVRAALLTAVSGHPEYGDNQVNNGWTPPLYYIEFDYYSAQATPKLAVRFRNSTTNAAWAWAWVNGQPVTANAENMTASASNTPAFYGLTFAAAGKYRVRIYMYVMGLGGLDVAIGDSVVPVREPVPKFAWIGDSYIDSGTGATSAAQGMAASAGRLLGVEMFSFGQGGTGYANNGGGTFGKAVYSDPGRVAGVVSVNPDCVLVYGSTNDDSQAAATVQANATSLYAQLAAALPRVPVIVIGAAYTGTPPAGRLTSRNATKAAALAASNVIAFIDPLDPMGLVSTASAWVTGHVYAVNDTVVSSSQVYICRTAHTSGATFAGDLATKWQPTTWVTGTGKVGTTTGDGNADFLVSADGVHPSQAGHDQDALVMSSKISDALRAKLVATY